MNTKILIFTVVLVFAFFGGAYFILSPIAKQELDGPVVEQEASSTPTTMVVEKVLEKKPVDKEPSKAPSPVSVTAPLVVPVNTSTDTPASPVVASGYTMVEVEAHASADSCWSVIAGNVYDLTAYIPKHPGGSGKILKICGKDGSSLFEGQHGGESKPEAILENYKIGKLQ
ncbi:MAG: cytochrome b5 domain-containing protein [Candidatus Vogelbacteria bacterium]|nr:cytochrome b5 domain-containing protein [Candidatus Vogelbacteria bacterium]